MRTQKRNHRLRLAISLALSLLARPGVSATDAEHIPLVVVVHADNPISSLSIAELQQLFSRQRVHWDSGQRVVPLNSNRQSPMRVVFDRAVLGMEPAEVQRFWIDRRIRGHLGAPKELSSSSLTERIVSRLPEAIGYVRADRYHGHAKAIRVNGIAWKNSAYPLRMRHSLDDE